MIINKYSLINNHAAIQRSDGLWNYVDNKNNILSPYQWFDWVDDFHQDYGIVRRQNDKLYNFIRTDGTIISPSQWFYSVCNFHDGFAAVQREDSLWNWLNFHNGELLLLQWKQNVTRQDETLLHAIKYYHDYISNSQKSLHTFHDKTTCNAKI